MSPLVNENPERLLAVSYAPPAVRAGFAALLRLDERLAHVARRGTQPLVAQMRLTWWHQALRDLDVAPAPAEPLLRTLGAETLPRGVSGQALAEQVEAWEALLDADPADLDDLCRAAEVRGRTLFARAAVLLGAERDWAVGAGEAWGVAEQALLLTDSRATEARGLAAGRIAAALAVSVGRGGRPLGALVLSARADLDGRYAPGHPRRVARLAWHRLTGR